MPLGRMPRRACSNQLPMFWVIFYVVGSHPVPLVHIPSPSLLLHLPRALLQSINQSINQVSWGGEDERRTFAGGGKIVEKTDERWSRTKPIIELSITPRSFKVLLRSAYASALQFGFERFPAETLQPLDCITHTTLTSRFGLKRFLMKNKQIWKT